MLMPENNYRVVCFGEIFWDVLPAVCLIPEGAPTNVAFHLKKPGINTTIISKIDTDNKEEQLINLMEGNLISTDCFQMDSELRLKQSFY